MFYLPIIGSDVWLLLKIYEIKISFERSWTSDTHQGWLIYKIAKYNLLKIQRLFFNEIGMGYLYHERSDSLFFIIIFCVGFSNNLLIPECIAIKARMRYRVFYFETIIYSQFLSWARIWECLTVCVSKILCDSLETCSLGKYLGAFFHFSKIFAISYNNSLRLTNKSVGHNSWTHLNDKFLLG